MNTLALSEYIREVAEENPLLDWSEERPLLPEDEKLLQKLEWLQESDEQNRGFYQTEMDNEKEREDLRYGKKEAQSLRAVSYTHLTRRPVITPSASMPTIVFTAPPKPPGSVVRT